MHQKRMEAPERFQMIRPKALAEKFGVSPQTIRRWFADRAVVVTTGSRKRPHRTFLISQQAVDDWMEEKRRAS